MVVSMNELQKQYQAVTLGVAIHERLDRGLIEIRGRDRAAWLHNVFSNEIKKLQAGEGHYGFALNVKGRILFDANAFVSSDRILLDIDHQVLPEAISHLNKYIIMEDVQLQDRSGEVCRLAVLGQKLGAFAQQMSWPSIMAMSQLQHIVFSIDAAEVRIMRHDFVGVPTVELIAPLACRNQIWNQWIKQGALLGMMEVDEILLDIVRVEEGIPRWPSEINGEVLPAETRQLERAVSFHKGCYLGQEIVERMRAHQSIAKLLVKLVFEDESVDVNSILSRAGQNVGRVTSVVLSVRSGKKIGLGYVKSELAKVGTELQVSVGDSLGYCTVME